MKEHTALESRVATLIRAYAARAPIDVDPIAMTRLAADGNGMPASVRFGFVPAGRSLAFALVVLAVAGAIAVGALIAGTQPFRRDPAEILTDRVIVEPFIGLPPEGVAPSTPETGQLVLSFGGRVQSISLDFHRIWVFADGRVIWKRNLDGLNDAGRRAFGPTGPTSAVIEQRLTPEGVELIRARALASGLRDIEPAGTPTDVSDWGGPGVIWGGLVVHDGARLVAARWSDHALPGLLADPASWLPASAWEDARIAAYVPSRYAVCLEHTVLTRGAATIGPAATWDLLPEPTRNLIRSKAIGGPDPIWNEHDRRCLYEVSTGDVGAIAAALEDAGLGNLVALGVRREPRGLPIYAPIDIPSYTGEGTVLLLVVLPNGEVVCHCG